MTGASIRTSHNVEDPKLVAPLWHTAVLILITLPTIIAVLLPVIQFMNLQLMRK